LIRPCVASDLPWVLSLCHRRYTEPPDPGRLLAWVANTMQSLDAYVIRNEVAFCVALCQHSPWYPDRRECDVTILVAEKGGHWQAIKLLRATIVWARARECRLWTISSQTEHDLTVLARRVGAKPIPFHGIEL
jgi:hypothetical protein